MCNLRVSFAGTDPAPQSILALQHKPTSRQIQRRVAPEATPQFALIDGEVPFSPPFFAKPVVGRLSQNTYRIEQESDLLALHELDRYTARYGRIAALAGADPSSVHGFLAEELLEGDEVTPQSLRAKGLVHKHGLVKVLGRGELHRAVTVKAHAFSKSAVEAIKASGGSVEVIPLPWGEGRPPAKGNALTNR